ncbi:MAG: hypothetical protein ACR2H3_07095 [Acidimicrobiales bacterium]
MGRVGVFPGTFNPMTVAHVAIAEAAWRQLGLDRLDLVVSKVPLAKEALERPTLEHRVGVLLTLAKTRPWIGVAVTEAKLLADIASGYDVIVIGADKWTQLRDPIYYGGDVTRRDDAIRRLPMLAVVARSRHVLPAGATLLDLPPGLAEVSATGVRAGATEWMAPEAAEFDRLTGAWTDPDRYDRWVEADSDSPRSS